MHPVLERTPIVFVSVRVLAEHHAPGREQPVRILLSPNLKSPAQDFKVVTSPSMKRLEWRLPAWAAVVISAHASGAAPMLTGYYRVGVGKLAVVEFSIPEGAPNSRVGKSKLSSNCAVKPDAQVVTGSLEGNVFVGEVLVCQEGPSCSPRKVFSVLGVVRDDSGAMVATVKPDTNCSSPSLKNFTLELVPATREEKNRVIGESSTAEAVAKGKKSDEKSDEKQESDGLAGKEAWNRGDFAAARDAFLLAIANNPGSWEFQLGLGAARIKLADFGGANESLERALTLAQRARAKPSEITDIYYNLACAQAGAGRKKEAIGSLRTMATFPLDSRIVEGIDLDADLASLRSDPEFRRLVGELRTPREKGRKPK